MYQVVETNGTCASTGNPSIFRTISRHRTIAAAVRSWHECPWRSYKIVDQDGNPVRWVTDGEDVWVEVAQAAFAD